MSDQAQQLKQEWLHPSMERLIDLAPYKPYCSDNKTASSILPFAIARNREYIQINQPTKVCWLIFDIDEPNPYVWEDKGLPPPNIITSTPETLTSHLCYAIDPVCISAKGNKKIVSYMKAVRAAFTDALGADRDYNSPVTKNPLHPRWKVWNPTKHVYSLDELSEYVDLNARVSERGKYQGQVGIVLDPEGRNCSLFHSLRLWGYSQVFEARAKNSYEQWHRRVLVKAEQLNVSIARKFKTSPLPYSEVKATVKSVAGFCWYEYTGSHDNRGVMEMAGTDIPLENKQRLSARRTHDIRRNKTLARLISALKVVAATGEALNKVNLARYAKVSRQTVATYWEELQPSIEKLGDADTPVVEEKLVRAVVKSVKPKSGTISLTLLAKNTGIDRRKLKKTYPAIFDP